jgi:hypothetical protein
MERAHSHEAPKTFDWKKIQKILNQSWPLHDRNGKAHARGIPDRPSILVRARIVWELDGEEWIDARATRWTRTHVHVEFADPRAQINGAWLRADDVKRR